MYFKNKYYILVESSPIEIKPELQPLLGKCTFVSATYRIFKPPAAATNKKTSVTYNGRRLLKPLSNFIFFYSWTYPITFLSGTIEELPNEFVLSADYIFKTNVSRVSYNPKTGEFSLGL